MPPIDEGLCDGLLRVQPPLREAQSGAGRSRCGLRTKCFTFSKQSVAVAPPPHARMDEGPNDVGAFAAFLLWQSRSNARLASRARPAESASGNRRVPASARPAPRLGRRAELHGAHKVMHIPDEWLQLPSWLLAQRMQPGRAAERAQDYKAVLRKCRTQAGAARRRRPRWGGAFYWQWLWHGWPPLRWGSRALACPSQTGGEACWSWGRSLAPQPASLLRRPAPPQTARSTTSLLWSWMPRRRTPAAWTARLSSFPAPWCCALRACALRTGRG